jgi:hypothetical protein
MAIIIGIITFLTTVEAWVEFHVYLFSPYIIPSKVKYYFSAHNLQEPHFPETRRDELKEVAVDYSVLRVKLPCPPKLIYIVEQQIPKHQGNRGIHAVVTTISILIE